MKLTDNEIRDINRYLEEGKPLPEKVEKRGLAERNPSKRNRNQLYVNLSEIDDEDFKVSDEDKELNRLFYGEAYNG